MDLPIHAALAELLAALGQHRRALLIAPPGAGKTTAVAPALLDEPWCTGEVLLLVPRRLAARAAAEFMARQMDEVPGRTIGYATRLDSKIGTATRVVAMTYGVFLSRIQSDPELAGVSAVLFDEVHERSLDNDLSLALALDAAGALRPDLRILAMSATPDGERLGSVLGDPPKIVSEGRSHSLELRHIGRDTALRVEQQMAAAIRAALIEHEGSLLAFLPGVAEIERTADALEPLSADCVLHKLHGGIEPSEQRAALAPPAAGKRKAVLSTSIAETSVTLEDVRIVIDSGLARRPRYDRGAGLTRLVTEKASRAAVTQRAGRAARQAPGIAIRLWDGAATASLPSHDPPEIHEADLSGLLLTCLLWGEADPARLPFVDQPPASGLVEARERLRRVGAIGDDGRVTEHGRAMARLPLEPRLAHMLIEARQRGFGAAAADVAILLSERGLGGNDPDLEQRWRRWNSDRSARAQSARNMARRLTGDSPAARPTSEQIGLGLALAFPDRLSRRREASGENWQSVGGRGFRLDPASPLASNEWLAVGEVAGRASGARIVSAAAISERDVLELFRDSVEARREAEFESSTGGVSPVRIRRLGAIQLVRGPDPDPDLEAIEKALLEGVRGHGLALLPWSESSLQFRHRATFAASFDPAIPALDDACLLGRLDDWLAPLLAGKRKLGEVEPARLYTTLEQMLGYEGVRIVDRMAPAQFDTPAGSSHRIDYSATGGPIVEVRAQALFGLSAHPMVGAGKVPLTLAITSPAGRPIQTTKDLLGFWKGSWRDVAREMRGRYPRHAWPDDPASAAPTLKSKRASRGMS